MAIAGAAVAGWTVGEMIIAIGSTMARLACEAGVHAETLMNPIMLALKALLAYPASADMMCRGSK